MMQSPQTNQRSVMSDCKHLNKRYVRVNRGPCSHLSVQCTDCHDLVKLERHYYRLAIKAFEIPSGTIIVDIDYSEVARHG